MTTGSAPVLSISMGSCWATPPLVFSGPPLFSSCPFPPLTSLPLPLSLPSLDTEWLTDFGACEREILEGVQALRALLCPHEGPQMTMSQGDSRKMGTTGCLCVPAQPASFISQSPSARQQEDKQGQTAFIQSIYIELAYTVQHGTCAHYCLFYGP